MVIDKAHSSYGETVSACLSAQHSVRRCTDASKKGRKEHYKILIEQQEL